PLPLLITQDAAIQGEPLLSGLAVKTAGQRDPLGSAKCQQALDDAIQIWHRRLAGDAQHVLAAEFGVNPGRIAEVLAGKRFPQARAIALGGNVSVDIRT
ncbi:MAG: hypothetical protein ACREE4_09865, partial [Stellaceae bacterium]